jgi:SurA N-terminal domain
MNRRIAAVVGVLVIALIAVAAVALSRQNDSGGKAVASVAGERVTRRQLDLMVEHFHEEADREGRPFPRRGTAAFRRVERQSLALLLDRAKIEAAATRLGIHVSSARVAQRLAAAGGGEEEGGATIRAQAEGVFRRSTTRAQLVTEAVFAKVTADVRVPPAAVRGYYRSHRTLYGSTPLRKLGVSIRRQLLAARRNEVMTRWLQQARATRVKILDEELKG